MWKTILRRVLLMLPQIFILSVLAFLIAKMIGGSIYRFNFIQKRDPNTIEALRVKFNLWSTSCSILELDFKSFPQTSGQSYTYKYEVAGD